MGNGASLGEKELDGAGKGQQTGADVKTPHIAADGRRLGGNGKGRAAKTINYSTDNHRNAVQVTQRKHSGLRII